MQATNSVDGSGSRLTSTPSHALVDLFLASVLVLFLELACIRWFPAHVLFLTFFTNVVLLACFVGMSVGCLAAGRTQNYIRSTPILLVLAVAAAHGVEMLRDALEHVLDVGGQSSPQLVYFGTEYGQQDVAAFSLPIEVVAGGFFLLLALVLVGPGQELGRALTRVPNRVLAYTVNILGSLVGIALFAACSWFELPPFFWFLPPAVLVGYFLWESPATRRTWVRLALLGIVVLAVSKYTGSRDSSGSEVWAFFNRMVGVPRLSYAAESAGERVEFYWSPYYRVDYGTSSRMLRVNLIGHQRMTVRTGTEPAYALPYLLNRDSGGAPYKDILIIGAGSGSDLSRALQWAAPDAQIDAVEIDPVIQRLGERDHPDKPYNDPRVRVYLDDGRNFLRQTSRQYDLIVYALVDSLVLHSSYSNIRLESYLFTREAFQDVHRCLKPDGMFAMYNYFRQGWIVSRLDQTVETVFEERPLVMTLPYEQFIEPEKGFNGFTFFLIGKGQRMAKLHETFALRGDYRLQEDRAPSPESPNGFAPEATRQAEKHPDQWWRFGPAAVERPQNLRLATDAWPFLYLREPMLPNLSLRGMLLMGLLALGLIYWFKPDSSGSRPAGSLWDGRMFFLGAGFMLIETKAVVHMALLFGSTWMVNSVVFFAILVMILGANLFVLTVRPRQLWVYYVGLLGTLALNFLVPLDFFLSYDRAVQVAGSCLLLFAPMLFAAVIFAVSFGQRANPDLAFGANIAGALAGGLAEYASMLLGFQYLMLVALAFYALSAISPQPDPKLARQT